MESYLHQMVVTLSGETCITFSKVMTGAGRPRETCFVSEYKSLYLSRICVLFWSRTGTPFLHFLLQEVELIARAPNSSMEFILHHAPVYEKEILNQTDKATG